MVNLKKQTTNKHKADVLLGIWTDRQLRDRGQAAVKILGYDTMTNFIEKKLQEAIEQAGIAPRVA